MEPSSLRPFLRHGLDILFAGLNPAKGSSRKGHYFSVKSAFWDQLFEAGLIAQRVNKDVADEIVFGSSEINRNGWNYGITDLVTAWAESDSTKVEPTDEDCSRLADDIRNYRPRLVVLLHSKVRNKLAAFLGVSIPRPYGALGRWLTDVPSEFFSVPFPHGNSIPSTRKVALYREVVRLLERETSTRESKHGMGSTAAGRAPPRRSPSRARLRNARKIDAIIERSLKASRVGEARPKDVMPVLIEHGIYARDYKNGLPLRKLLRELDDSGQLSLMKTVHVERRAKNRLWFFRLPD